MKHAAIFAHPKPGSFTASVAATYAQANRALGHEVVVRDLYQMGFNPCLKAEELPFDTSFKPEADVLAERDILRDCDVFAFFYPLWLNAPPAMLKGYLERVFGFGFAYGGEGHSYNPLLTGRKMISFSSSGAPSQWLEQIHALEAVRILFDSYFAKLCGMTVVDHIHVGAIRAGASDIFIQARLNEVSNTVNHHFGRKTCH